MEALQVGTLAPRSPTHRRRIPPKTDFKEAHNRGRLEDIAKFDLHRPHSDAGCQQLLCDRTCFLIPPTYLHERLGR